MKKYMICEAEMDRVLIISSNTQKLKDLQRTLEGAYRLTALPLINGNMRSEINEMPDCIVVYVEGVSRQKLFGIMDLREQDGFREAPLLLIADDSDTEIFKLNVNPGADFSMPVDSIARDIRLNVERLCETSEKQKSVLVVDDDAVSLKIIRSYLEDDYTVTCVKSGRLAMKFLEKQKPDAVLLDCFMPEMDGAQTLQLIRSVSTLKRLPVVFLTGNTEKTMVMNCLSLHPSGFLVKPVKRDDLLKKLDEII